MSAKFRFVSNGNVSCVELDEKTLGKGVESVEFSHSADGDTKMKLDVNLKRFSFMPDGYFDEFEQRLKEECPPEDMRNGRS